MTDRRTYGDSCGIARALDLVGERWALLIVRELLLGPKRFTDLRAGLSGVGPDILAQRLRELEGAGLVIRRRLAPPAAARVYELTPRGAELEPALVALGRWGSRVALPPRPASLSPDALAVALKTMYSPRADGRGGRDGEEHRHQLVLGEHQFGLRVSAAGLEIDRGQPEPPVTTLRTDPGTLAGLLWHGGSLDAALADGRITIAGGSREDVVRFLTLFEGSTLPEDAGQ